MVSRISVLQLFASLVVSMIMISMATASSTPSMSLYSGTWRLDELYDDSAAPVALPKDHDFVMLLAPAKDISGLPMSDNDFQISITIGNTLNTFVTIADPTTSLTNVEMKFVRSSMMMPPQDLFPLEMFLTDALPKMKTFKLEEPNLTLQGTDAAKIVFTRVDA